VSVFITKKSLLYLFLLLGVSTEICTAISAPKNVKIEVNDESWDTFINKALLIFDPVYYNTGAEASYGSMYTHYLLTELICIM